MAGKVLSKINSTAMKKAFLDIGHVLVMAGLMEEPLLQQLKDLLLGKKEQSSKEEAVSAAADSVFGSDDLDHKIRRSAWREKLRAAIVITTQKFADVHERSERDFEILFGNDKTRSELASEFIVCLTTILYELIEEHPGPAQKEFEWIPPILSLRERDDYWLYASAKDQESLSVEFDFDILLPAGNIDVAASKIPNQLLVEGVLFRIDEPSDAAPFVGPGLPLYISEEVASSLVDKVHLLPFDAHETLSEHADDQVAGVIEKAEIKGKDFCVRGALWPVNKPEQVNKIAAEIEDLGMSMNAKVTGRRGVVNGIKVFVIETLKLLGANILYADKAAYRKSSLKLRPSLINAKSIQSEASELTPEVLNSFSKLLRVFAVNE